MKTHIRASLQIATLLWLVAGVAEGSDLIVADRIAERCGSLTRTDFTSIKDAPTKITSAKVIQAADGTPTHCLIRGYTLPGIGILLRVPTAGWNKKYLQLGCGGGCGTTEEATGDFTQCVDSIKKGYACALSDNGHNGVGFLWAHNNLQAEVDHAYHGAHATALASKAIVTYLYNEAPKQSYFWGYSTGGRQALVEAQRFPWDFDGIVAGCPSIAEPALLIVSALWTYRTLIAADGKLKLSSTQIDALHDAVVAHCDLNDGVKDGLIGDPRQCTYDPASLSCRSGRKPECLTDSQVDVVRKLYAGPATSRGERIYFPGPMLGSEKFWHRLSSPGFLTFIEESLRSIAFYPDPPVTWKAKDFDFDEDYKRFGVAEGLYSPTNPDLRRFKAAGGKLISFVGWNDVVGMPLPVIDYYEMVENAMGGRNETQSFFRLFALPGVQHCTNGEGPFAVDWLSALEAWVERDIAPDELIGAHVKLQDAESPTEAVRLNFPLDPERVLFTRPLYPYPKQTMYLGQGDPNSAASFGAN